MCFWLYIIYIIESTQTDGQNANKSLFKGYKHDVAS